MILKKIYSNIATFKELNFTDNINFIIGGKLETNGTFYNQHNVGKTLSLEIIDFCLLSDFNKEKKLFHLQEELIEYTFSLILKIKDNDYLTIRRSIEYPNVVKILEHDKEEVFNDNDKFKERTVKDTENTLSDILSDIYGFQVNFRKFTKRFIRFSDQYQDPLNIEANKKYRKYDIDWIPGLMNSLGFNYDNIYNFYSSKKQIESLTDKIKHFKKAFDITCTKTNLQKLIDKLDTDINQKNISLKKYEDDMKSFIFTDIDKDIINKNLVSINEKIHPLNKERFYIQKRINNLNKTLNIDLDYNLDESLYKFYSELNLVFKDNVKKSFDELEMFNKQLLEERKIIAKDQLKILKKELIDIDIRLKDWNAKHQEKLEALNNTDFQEKFISANQELDTLKQQIFEKESDKSKYKKILTNVNLKANAEQDNKDEYTYYSEEKIKPESLISKLDEEFSEELYKAINQKITLKFNEKKPLIEMLDEDNKAIVAGSTHTKIISIFYDILLSKMHNSKLEMLTNSIIHDNLFTDMQDNLKEKTYLLIKEISEQKSVQYIITDFKDSIPASVIDMINKKKINLVAELYRNEIDYSQTLFSKNLKKK